MLNLLNSYWNVQCTHWTSNVEVLSLYAVLKVSTAYLPDYPTLTLYLDSRICVTELASGKNCRL